MLQPRRPLGSLEAGRDSQEGGCVVQVVTEPTVDLEVQRGPDPSAPRVVELTPRQIVWRIFRRDRWAMFSLFFILLMILLAVFAPVIAKYVIHHDPNHLYLDRLDRFNLPTGPSKEFWFGVDDGGRDVFVRILYGARTSLMVALFATGLAVGIGTCIGLTAGFYRGRTDTILSRFTDIVMSLPVLLLALGLVAGCGVSAQGCLGGVIRPGLLLVSYVIGLFTWPYVARLVRGEVLRLREKEFVDAARAVGASDMRIIWREVLPNVVAPILVYTTLIIPNNILFEAALSFLGIGVPPGTPSWGKMLSDAGSIFTVAWWMMVFPGLFLFTTTLAFNLVGDGLRDALDPRSRR
jgi:ABC-type dipeptide/oligopeptide/nickel transport system permease subunit